MDMQPEFAVFSSPIRQKRALMLRLHTYEHKLNRKLPTRYYISDYIYTNQKTAAIDVTVPTIPFRSIRIFTTDKITIGRIQ